MSRNLSKLVRKFGSARVEEMQRLYVSQGKHEMEIDTYLEVALENCFKQVRALRVNKYPVCRSMTTEIIGSYVYYSRFINL